MNYSKLYSPHLLYVYADTLAFHYYYQIHMCYTYTFFALLALKCLIYVYLNSWCKQMQGHEAFCSSFETPSKSICPLQLLQGTESCVCMYLCVWTKLYM